MKRNVLLLGCWAAMSVSVQAGELYRWMDPAGKVHYGDVPSVDAKEVETRKIPDSVKSDEELPYEARRAMQNFPVTLYVSDGCGETCDQARSLLNKRGIPFSEKFLRTKQEVDAFKHLSGLDSVVPVLAVGKNFLKGFLESQWNSELDFASYPKTAPYRAPKSPSSNDAASQVAPANPAAPEPAYPISR